MGEVSTSSANPLDTSGSRYTCDPASSALLLHHIHQGSMALSLLVLLLLLLLLSGHHASVAHLVHHNLSLVGRHPLGCPLGLLLLWVLKWSSHPLLLELYLRGQLAMWDVTLLRRLLHGPAGANHHPCRSTLLLIHVGPSSCHCHLGLRWHALGSYHAYRPWVSHAHLLTLTLLMLSVRRHQLSSCLGCLSL